MLPRSYRHLVENDPERAGGWSVSPAVWSPANKLVQQKLSKLGPARVSRDMARETELTGEVPRLFDSARTTTCGAETCSWRPSFLEDSTNFSRRDN
jgi:hypothetical protein